jgi:hypothetical protein
LRHLRCGGSVDVRERCRCVGGQWEVRFGRAYYGRAGVMGRGRLCVTGRRGRSAEGWGRVDLAGCLKRCAQVCDVRVRVVLAHVVPSILLFFLLLCAAPAATSAPATDRG